MTTTQPDSMTKDEGLLSAAINAVAQIEMDREGYPLSRTQEEIYEDAAETVQAVLALLPTPSSADNTLREALEPWADFHGELPDYDHPLRCVFESGIQYAVELLAKTLGVEDYEVCDGTEEFDGDLGGTLFNIVLAAMPTDEHGDPMHPEQVRDALASSPAAEVEPEASHVGLGRENAAWAWLERKFGTENDDPVDRAYDASEMVNAFHAGCERSAAPVSPTPVQTGALDWLKVAKLAGVHGIRYRTNRALEQFLAALSQPGSSESGEWRPIETAPKDGTAVLALLTGSDLPHTIRYRDGAWLIAWDAFDLSADSDRPTHWMTLPSTPPSKERQP